MARFYIATTISRWAEHNIIRDILEAHGHRITYDWTVNTHHGDLSGMTIDEITAVGNDEMAGIATADFMVVLLPGGYGTHAEIGAAHITSLPTFIHAFDPAFFDNEATTGKLRNFYLGTYMTRLLSDNLVEAGEAVLRWWDNFKKPEDSPPGHLAHLVDLEPCDDCPVGGRWTPEEGDREATCARAPLCDWEAAHSDY